MLTDNAGGARSGVSHLISNGHRRIGFIGDSPDIYTAAQRRLGYLSAMSAASLAVADCWVRMGSPDRAGIGEALRRMLAGRRVPGTGAARCTAHRLDRPRLGRDPSITPYFPTGLHTG